MKILDRILYTILSFRPNNLKDGVDIAKEEWSQFGTSCRRDTPPTGFKHHVVSEYQKRYDHAVFIETGTFKGDMVNAQLHNFSKIISIELGRHLYRRACKRFAEDYNVTILRGDSGTLLYYIMRKLNEPAIFWLDAHFAGGITAGAKKKVPVMKELDAIFSSPFNHVILIDDARGFDGTNHFPTIEDLTMYISRVRPELSVSVKDDIIRII